MSNNIRSLCKRKGLQHSLFQEMQDLHQQNGGIDSECATLLAESYLLSPAAIFGSTSFYDFLRADEAGIDAHLCDGTSCVISATQATNKQLVLDHYQADTIGRVKCLGLCYSGGGFMHRDKVLAGDLTNQLANTAQPEAKESSPPYYCKSRESIFTDIILDLDEFYGLCISKKNAINAELRISQLQGRGGGAFLFWKKLVATKEMMGEKLVVCNADEGDPGAFSDKYLLEQQPHKVLGGMYAAALSIGATRGFIYIRKEYPRARTTFAKAIADFEATTAFKTDCFQCTIVSGSGSYVCGEETALLNSIEGLRPEVRVRPPYPAQQGLYDQPTLLSNVETFACIPSILKNGSAKFAALGSNKSKGNKLISLDHGFAQPGVYEVELGMALQDLIDHAGGFSKPTKALQIGGPLGGIVPTSCSDLSVDYESFTAQGFLLGHGGIIAIPRDFSMFKFMLHLFQFMAMESCGKCFPCRLGTKKGHTMLVNASLENPIDTTVFMDLLDTMEHASLCGLGAGVALPIRNIMTHFSGEIRPYFSS